MLADCRAPRTSWSVRPTAARRVGSTSTITARPGPPTVFTSRVPGTRLISASTLRATRSRSKAPVSARVLCSVSATMGTSSTPFGLMMGCSTPRPLGSQSALAPTVSYRRTTAAWRGTPTLNCTVTTATPGRDTLITCSTPVICDSTCSAGVATMASTSFALAPGNGTITLAMVTSICGSSSRGVTNTANRPSRKATSASSGVICALWK